jgi:F-type H+-transporting ATPase subunit alpha
MSCRTHHGPRSGSLKLAYSQFEELEAFAKFGTRLDEATQKTIDHGQRIRACLKQSESHPVSMIEQIIVLLALTEGLFDPLPLDKVNDAEQTVQKAAANIPADVAERLTSSNKFSDEDRKAILEIAKRALASLQPVAAAKPATKSAP